jgi:hypothetical protein
MSRRKVWCIAWHEGGGEVGWCAAENQSHAPDENAFNVDTACGLVVTLPMGCEKRVPTCKQCREVKP